MLREIEIAQAKPKSKRYKLHDINGLYLLIKPNGAKKWQVGCDIDESVRTIKGLSYPKMSLAAARVWCLRVTSALTRDADPKPSTLSSQQLVRTDDNQTFEHVARDWHGHASRHWSRTYSKRILQNFEKDLFPELGDLSIALIDGPCLRNALKKIEVRGALEPCRRLRSQCGSVFKFAMAEGKAKFDPSASIIDALPKRNLNNHRAVLKIARVPALFAALSNKRVKDLTKYAIRWTLLNMVRSQETRHARYDELEGLDGPTPQWRIPAGRIKTGIEHTVPLSKQAVRLICDIRMLGVRGQYIFPSEITADGVISHNRMLDCIKSIGLQGEVTIHGFRGLASTVLNEATRIDDKGELVRLWDADWVERQLAHVESRQSRRAYNSAEWIGPRRRMMQWWADWLDIQEFGELQETSISSSRGYQFVN